MQPENNIQPSHLPSVKSSVYDRIKCEKICPKSRLFFLSQECLVWCLWVVSVLLGALAVAVALFVITHHQYALYEATHENFFTFVVEALPYLWILVFGFMALGAAYNIRHTKHGYRYSLWHILLSSVAFSLAGGFALQLFGLGYTVDHFLGQQMRAYMSQEKMEQRLWQNPTDGRLLGHLTHHTLATSSSIIFLDTIGDSWQVDVSELTQRERALVEGKGTVRLIGQISDEKVRRFHSCGAFSWVVDESMSREDMRLAREEFLLRVGGYKEQAEKVLYRDEEALEIEEGREESPCGEIAPVHRIRKAKEFDGE